MPFCHLRASRTRLQRRRALLQAGGVRRADLVPAARKVPVSALRLDVSGIRYHG